MVNAIEAFCQVGVQHIFALEPNTEANGFERVMGAASWSKPIAVWFKAGLPLGFEREFHEGLKCSISHGGNPLTALLGRARLGYPNPPDRECFLVEGE